MIKKQLYIDEIPYKKIGNSIIFDIDSLFARNTEAKFHQSSGFNIDTCRKSFLGKRVGNIHSGQNNMAFSNVKFALFIYFFREGGFRP